MARTTVKGDPKKATEVKIEIMEDSSDLPALDLQPYIDENKSFEVRGNYEKLKAALTTRRDEILKLKFSAKDIETVTKYKKEAQGLRTMLTSLEKDTKAKYFNAPKDVFVAKMATLQSIVGEIEEKADKVLDAEEEKRVVALNKVFDIYKSDLQAEYKLSPEGLASVEYKKNYYNKTAKEIETLADLTEQFRTIQKREKAFAAGEKTIRSACAGNALLNVERYVQNLTSGTDLAIILEEIADEKTRLSEATKAEAEKNESAEPSSSAPVPTSERVVIGVRGAAGDMLTKGSDFPGKTKKKIMEIEYPLDYGDALNVVFKELRRYGIKIRPYNEV